jgi:NADH:ubiquinone oxidoreductase subunit E
LLDPDLAGVDISPMNAAASNQTAVPWDATLARDIAEQLKGLEGALLPILHALNDRFGYVDEQAIPMVADVLNLTRAEVHGVDLPRRSLPVPRR